MNKEIKNEWLQALKSDKYTQGSAMLRNENVDGIVCHCCLGVLADVMGEEISEDGMTLAIDKEGFTMYDEQFIKVPQDTIDTLYGINDDSHREGERKYESVIKIIENIVTD
tara:strand:- start:708 stop:1040 length:333 start_codon:yes stop_codon:yes gene_type:complete